MKRLSVLLVVVMLLLPGFAHAAWWNPVTWFKHSADNHQTRQDSAKQKPLVKRSQKPISAQKPSSAPAVSTLDNRTVSPSQTNTQAIQQAQIQQAAQAAAQAQAEAQAAAQRQAELQREADQRAQQQQAAQAAAQAEMQRQADLQRAQQQAQAAAQEKLNQINAQINALTDAYKSQEAAISQQIIDIKNQYYKDVADVESRGGVSMFYVNGMEQKLLTDANRKIDQLNLQLQQDYLDYTQKVRQVQATQ